MKKIIHIFIIIFSIFSLNLQATNMLFDNNHKCEHSETKKDSQHNHSDKKMDCCDEQCNDCFECKLCTNYVKLFLNINFTEYDMKEWDFYQYFYHIKESHPKKSIIPPIV